MIHDFKFFKLQPSSSSVQMGERPTCLWWWCVCGGYQGSSDNMRMTGAIEGFMVHLQPDQEPRREQVDQEKET